MEALRAKYSRPREQLVAEANSTMARGGGPKAAAPFGGQSDALADIIMCQACGAMGTVKKQYGFRVMDEQCEKCNGEGVIKKGLAKTASQALKDKVRKVEEMIATADDLVELERLEAALQKKTEAALDEVIKAAEPAEAAAATIAAGS